MNVIIAVDDVFFAHQRAEERQRRFNSVDHDFIERTLEPHQAFGARLSMHDQLADEQIVVGRNRVALIDRGIDANTEASRRVVVQDFPGRRTESDRIFCIDAAFDGVAVKFHVALLDGEVGSSGNADLLENQVNVGDHLGHRMLDLNACVHLNEVEFAVLIQEFDGADTEILDLAHCLGDRLADRLARAGIERGRGAFLPDLLVTPLQGAVALAEMDGISMAVTEHLNLDVAGALEIFLDIDCVIAERGLGLGAGGRKRGR